VLAEKIADEQIASEQASRERKKIKDAATVKLSNPFAERNGVGIGALVLAARRAQRAETKADRDLIRIATKKRVKDIVLTDVFELGAYEKQTREAQRRADSQFRAQKQLE